MVGRNKEYAVTDEEFWDERVDELQEAELPGGEPAVYIGEERYESAENAAEDIGVEAEELREIVYGGDTTPSSIPEDFDRDSRLLSAERHAGVTMDRPGNNPSHYDQNDERPADKEPHTEGPRYEDWATGFDDEEAMAVFSGLFEDDRIRADGGNTRSEGDRAFGDGYDVGLQN